MIQIEIEILASDAFFLESCSDLNRQLGVNDVGSLPSNPTKGNI